MTHISYGEGQPWTGQVPSEAGQVQAIRLLRTTVLVGLAYYLGAKVGFALTLKPHPVSTLWPPNSILLAALLLTSTSSWWALLAGAFVAHLAVQLQGGIPIPMVLGWFVSNASEALIGATIVRHYITGPLHLSSFRQVSIFVVGATFVGTAVSSFLDASFVSLVGWSQSSYWDVWLTRTPSNVLASLTLVPVIVTWANGGLSALRAVSARRYIEAGLMALGLLVVCVTVFGRADPGAGTAPVWLYAPLPFLVWAAIRFGPRGTSACLLVVTSLAIWGAVNGHGPFVTESPAQNALSIQLFMTVIAVPLLALAAVMRETERAEYSARENQARLNLALSASQVGAWEWRIPDATGSLSPKSRQILGLDGSDGIVTLDDFLSVVSPDDRATVSEAVRGAVEEGAPYECEFRVVGPDKSVRWVLSKGNVLYDKTARPERLLGVNVDITDRKSAERLRREEAALRESEARFRELADTTPVLVWQSGADRLCNFFNKHWLEFTGRTLEQESGNGWVEGVHPDDLQRCLATYFSSFEARQPFSMEYRLLRADGEYRWLLDNGVPRYTPVDQFTGYIGSCVDITEQKQAEQALREAGLELEERVADRTSALSLAVVQLREEIAERMAAERALRSSEERFGKAFRGSPDAMSIEGRPNERIIEINDKWETLFGFNRAETMGHSIAELGILERRDHIRLRLLLAKQGYVRELELNLRNKAGQLLQAVLTAERVEMGGELCTITLIRDVTERKRAELMLQEQQRELAHLSRVAALGELSGALAHELNQPLAAILANARAAQRMMAADQPDMPELREILDDIASDDRRAGEVISRLRSLLKKSDLQSRPVKLEDIVGEILSLLHSDLIERRVSAVTQLAPALPPVLGDRVQLQQVLLNLVLNACDSMADKEPGDRLVTIATRLTARGVVQLSVGDQGIGISEARLEQIFEPFVTTKENGLGLGLAISRSIIMAHGGRLWAVNNGDRGATFVMELDPTEAGSTTPTDAGGEDGRVLTRLSPAGTR